MAWCHKPKEQKISVCVQIPRVPILITGVNAGNLVGFGGDREQVALDCKWSQGLFRPDFIHTRAIVIGLQAHPNNLDDLFIPTSSS